MSEFSWPKEKRIRKTKNYQNVQSTGKRWRSHDFIVLYIKTDLEQSRIGITVSKKVGNAVRRNRVKRMIREGVRKEYFLLTKPWDIVIIARSSAFFSSTEKIQNQIQSVFKYLSRKL